ncbi:MAG: hypothetical protein LBD66_00395 [Holosporales bacterium]|nr:hypothetical protein [Holosporales bacterium]
MKHRSWIYAVLLCTTALSAKGMDFDPDKLSQIDFNDQSQQALLAPLYAGKSFGDCVSDGRSLQFPIQLLAHHFGYAEVNGWRVIDVSYSALKRYALRYHYLGDPYFNGLEGSADADLCAWFLRDILDISPLSSRDRTQFQTILREMGSHSAGRERMQSLIVMQHLIDNRFGEIGEGIFQRKKLTIRRGEEDLYWADSHTVDLSFSSSQEVLLQIDSSKAPSSALSSAGPSDIFLHEITHAYHWMFGIHGYDYSSTPAIDIVNTMQAAYLLDPYLRERLNPLLNKGVFDFVLEKIIESRLDQDMSRRTFEVTPFYQFLGANKFFGNDWLHPREFSEPEYHLWANMVYLTEELTRRWDDTTAS